MKAEAAKAIGDGGAKAHAKAMVVKAMMATAEAVKAKAVKAKAVKAKVVKAKTAEATAMLQAAEIKAMEAEAQSKRNKADTMLQVTEGVCEEMAEWLLQHRLQQCAADMVRIAGAYAQPPSFHHVVSPDRSGVWWSCCMCRTVLPSDLQYLTNEDVEEIGGPCRQSH